MLIFPSWLRSWQRDCRSLSLEQIQDMIHKERGKTKERGGKLELHGSKIEVELESCADRIVYELSMQVLSVFLEEVAELLPGLIEREDSF